MLLEKHEYQDILSELIQAHKDMDVEWFKANKKRCEKLSWHWTTLYIYSWKDKYSKAASKLEHILKMTKSKSRWKQYEREVALKKEGRAK